MTKIRHLVLFVLIAFLPGCEWPWSSGSSATEPLIEAFRKNEALENQVFGNLVFTYSHTFNKSVTQKFVVTDQLGRNWLFKIGRNAADGAIAQYRMMKLAGIDTPEIHRVTLNINGTPTVGTLQRFIKNLGDLERVEYSNLDQPLINMMMKNNIMSWMTGGHHVHFKQFLLASSDGTAPDRLYRIDNTIEWFLVGHDRLAYDYTTPILWHMGGLGYTTFWRRYFQKRLTPNLQLGLDWARLLSKLPDQFYKEFYHEGLQNDLAFFPNTLYDLPAREKDPQAIPIGVRTYPDIYHPDDGSKFLERIVERKNNLGQDIEKYFLELAKIRGQKVQFKDTDYNAVAKGLIEKLETNDARLREILAEIQSKPRVQQAVIEAPVSVAGYRVALNLYSAAIFDPVKLKNEDNWTKAISQLTELRDSAKYDSEKKAIIALLTQVNEDHEAFRNDRSSWKAIYGRVFRLQGDTQRDMENPL